MSSNLEANYCGFATWCSKLHFSSAGCRNTKKVVNTASLQSTAFQNTLLITREMAGPEKLCCHCRRQAVEFRAGKLGGMRPRSVDWS